MYRVDRNDFIRHLNFAICDLLLLQLVFLLPYFFDRVTPSTRSFYLSFQLIATLVDICTLFFKEAYISIFRRNYLKEAKVVAFHQSIVFAVTLVIVFFLRSSEVYSRLVVMAMWLISIPLVYAGRIVLKKFSMRYYRTKKTARSVLLITSYDRADSIIETMSINKHSDFRITGIAIVDRDDENLMGQDIRGVKIVAFADNMVDYIKNNVVDEVFISVSSDIDLSSEIVSTCIRMGVVVHYSLKELREDYCRNTIENFGGYTVLTKGVIFVTSRQLLLKRIIDICGSLAGLLLTGLCFLFVAPMIYIKSPGPIFFSQTRVGLNGRKFKIYKFRSMYMDAEERKAELMKENKMDGLMFKIDDDPRIIKGIGHFIRKFSIDELPQMWNVLMGTMSLVGTRPPTVDEYEQYDYHHKSRLSTKPGITGMWQVSGRSDITDFEEVVALDNKYIYNWHVGMDIQIILKTILVVFHKKGAV